MEMTERQRNVILGGATCVGGLAIVLTVLLVGYVLVKFANFAAPALMPMLLGLFLALLFKPLFDALRNGVRRISIPLLRPLPLRLRAAFGSCGLDTFVALLLFVGILLSVPLLLAFLVDFHALYASASSLAENIPALLGKAVRFGTEKFPALKDMLAGVADSAKDGSIDMVGLVGKCGANGAKAVGGFLRYMSGIQTLLMVIAFFLLFVVRKQGAASMSAEGASTVVDNMPFLKKRTRAFVYDAIGQFSAIMVGYFQKQVLIDFCEGVCFGLVLQFVMPYGFVLGFLFGFLNLIPVIGTLVCLPLVLPVAYFGEGGSLGRLLLVVGLIVVLQLVDQIVTTKVQGDGTNLSPVVVVFSYIFWGLVFQSFVGVLLAIPLTAFCKVLWDGLRKELPRDII